MSTFVGHSLAGTLIGSVAGQACDERQRRLLILFSVITAVLPDFDIVIFLVFQPQMVPHRGFSHTLLFALLSSGILTLVASRFMQMRLARLWSVLFLAALSHLLLDYLMGAGAPVPLFWPFLDLGFICPYKLVPVAYYGKVARAYFSFPFWALNGLAIALEIIIFVPMIVIARSGTSLRIRLLAAVVILAGLLLTVKIYN